MAQGKGYQGPRQRGHAGSILGQGSTGGSGYQGPSWDQYATKKKKKKKLTEGEGGGEGGGVISKEDQEKIKKVASAALGAYTGYSA